jgi:hypothetical protein
VVGAGADVDDDGGEAERGVGGRRPRDGDRPQFERLGEHDPVRQLAHAVQGAHIFEPLEVQGEDGRQVCDAQAALGFLEAPAGAAEKLVVAAQRLARGKGFEAGRDGDVRRDFEREVEKGLVAGGRRLARQAPRLAREAAPEHVVDPGGGRRGGGGGGGGGGGLAAVDRPRLGLSRLFALQRLGALVQQVV